MTPNRRRPVGLFGPLLPIALTGKAALQPPVENQQACEVILRHDRLLRRRGAPSNPTYTPIAALPIGFQPESFTDLGEGSNLTHVWDVLGGGGLIKRGVTIRQICMDKLFDSRGPQL